ncbi:ATP-binding cassette domain-containing protein [Sulfitobacter sp. F26169L]|uniref:amino acid ABC transporter ATP-binding/permease protein n=1 Tax=Sulfitobacter sp. F26169L TaxID=2996015 RepID=UPI0022608AC9|nr:ATP-binding cassette domain-containing protein [Sulfitobacter sp. F26169L]MCX7564996.1 ATP-binding cassette domain-containing protein [Sulfitobacter sp. F26169L]
MKVLLPFMRLLVSAAPWAMARGAALTVVVLLMGAALLGLSGWFITATGIAGIAGVGIAFDVFRPSAGVRFLALGRTAARYGERLLTHDATLRALAALRVTLLRRQGHLDHRQLSHLRSEAVLTRIISDVDALDGLMLRLVLPGMGALVTHVIAFCALGWLAGWLVAWTVLAGYLPLAVLVFWQLARRGVHPSDTVEAQDQKLRQGIIDMIRNRQALILGAGLGRREAELEALDTSTRIAARALDLAERNAGAAVSALVAVVVGLALTAGGWIVQHGHAGPAVAAIGVFVALALAETLAPLRRGVAEYGRMAGAAKRIGNPCNTPPRPGQANAPNITEAPLLSVHSPLINFDMDGAEALALTGPSGCGKTSLLMQIAGLADGGGVAIFGQRPDRWPDTALRGIVTMVPQRSALIAGTIRDNLALGAQADDDAMWRALAAVALDDDIAARGGLDVRLGEAGAGLSGGQAKRLALARALLKSPRLLLLDEPTEGLDAETADHVLSGIRSALPEAAIIAVLHRSADHRVFDRKISLAR